MLLPGYADTDREVNEGYWDGYRLIEDLVHRVSSIIEPAAILHRVTAPASLPPFPPLANQKIPHLH